jgi:hypothetical protein
MIVGVVHLLLCSTIQEWDVSLLGVQCALHCAITIVTGVEAPKADSFIDAMSSNIYTLDGRSVSTLFPRHIYIVGGKKVLAK